MKEEIYTEGLDNVFEDTRDLEEWFHQSRGQKQRIVITLFSKRSIHVHPICIPYKKRLKHKGGH